MSTFHSDVKTVCSSIVSNWQLFEIHAHDHIQRANILTLTFIHWALIFTWKVVCMRHKHVCFYERARTHTRSDTYTWCGDCVCVPVFQLVYQLSFIVVVWLLIVLIRTLCRDLRPLPFEPVTAWIVIRFTIYRRKNYTCMVVNRNLNDSLYTVYVWVCVCNSIPISTMTQQKYM